MKVKYLEECLALKILNVNFPYEQELLVLLKTSDQSSLHDSLIMNRYSQIYIHSNFTTWNPVGRVSSRS